MTSDDSQDDRHCWFGLCSLGNAVVGNVQRSSRRSRWRLPKATDQKIESTSRRTSAAGVRVADVCFRIVIKALHPTIGRLRRPLAGERQTVRRTKREKEFL
jgi:hypothetical protein